MSETVSNVEIEDVLSSIRRLVSENASGGDNIGAQNSGNANLAEKLVLTPAFRVLDGGGADENRPAARAAQEADEAPAPEAVQPEPTPDSGSDLEQKIAALEAAIGDTYDEWEPDGSEEEVAEAEPEVLTRATPAHREAEAEAGIILEATAQEVFEVEPEAMPEPAAEEQNSDPDDTTYLDEDALRDMVSILVREELQGHIGEKITRSVRRLVRREIQRTLALREFE